MHERSPALQVGAGTAPQRLDAQWLPLAVIAAAAIIVVGGLAIVAVLGRSGVTSTGAVAVSGVSRTSAHPIDTPDTPAVIQSAKPDVAPTNRPPRDDSRPASASVVPQPQVPVTVPVKPAVSNNATDFAPPPSASDFVDPPAPAPASAVQSTTPQRPVVLKDHPNPVLPAAALAEIRGIPDEQIGDAIDRGVGYLLSQFHDGQVVPEMELSEPQRQALDALCVYALLQSSRAVSDPRLNPRGTIVPAMLEKLRSYELVSDGKITNRPITYGRSLRAAALATLDRPEDRLTLKADVAWLIQNEIGGAYTYDDLYTQMMKQGMKPAIDDGPGMPAGPAAQPPAPPPAKPDGEGGFGGSSPPPSIGPGPTMPPPQVSLPPPPPTYLPRGQSPPPPGGSMTDFPPPKGGVWLPPTPGGAELMVPHPPNPRYQQPENRPYPQFERPYWVRFARPPGPSHPNLISGPGGGLIGGKYPGGVLLPPGSYGGGPLGMGDGHGSKIQLTFDFPWDNSNSQYGLLGVWAGAEVGMEVPDQYWRDVEQHWLNCELADGQWAYKKHDAQGYFAMTCAGVASLLVTHDYLDLPMLPSQLGRPPYSPGLAAGIAWLDRADNSVSIPGPGTHYLGYDLFGLERVGLASGYKFFGSHDWYRELATQIVPQQFPNGAWGHDDHGLDTLVDTAYTLLFLSRGRHPVVMTKLKFEPSWDNRPRDVANLARFAGKELERPLNWQVVGIDHPWYDWFDSPVLYIASHQAPKLNDDAYGKLRNFALAGGLIFTHADSGSQIFDKWVAELAKRITPEYPLKPIPDNDPIYSVQYKLGSHPGLLGISNGVRWLLVHCPADVAFSWQQRSDKTRLNDFRLGLNLFLYASGKPDLRNRIDSPFLPPPPNAPDKLVKLARLQYEGSWDPEPAAWIRFSRYLQWETGSALDIATVPVDQLAPGSARIAALTGIEGYTFTTAQTAAMRAYIQAGGVLLIDATGGENDFTQSIRAGLIRGAFADAQRQPLPLDHPLYKGLTPGTANSSPLRLRPYAVERLGQLAPDIQLFKLGKGYIVFSALDLTSGLLGTNTWCINGYQPESAQTFARNLVVWAGQSSGG